MSKERIAIKRIIANTLRLEPGVAVKVPEQHIFDAADKILKYMAKQQGDKDGK